MSPEYTFVGTMEIGVALVIGQLHAGNYWGSIAAEHFEHAAPLTAMGKLDCAFFEQRQVASHV
jgi:hypothetical protein